jgi:hypothetical protein
MWRRGVGEEGKLSLFRYMKRKSDMSWKEEEEGLAALVPRPADDRGHDAARGGKVGAWHGKRTHTRCV